MCGGGRAGWGAGDRRVAVTLSPHRQANLVESLQPEIQAGVALLVYYHTVFKAKARGGWRPPLPGHTQPPCPPVNRSQRQGRLCTP